jgi:hypothetical protein
MIVKRVAVALGLLAAMPVVAATLGPVLAPTLQAPASSPMNDYNQSVSADGRLMAFARSEADFRKARILVSERTRDGWSTPEPIGFSDERWRDSDPWLTPDGRTLYFVSDRPTASRPDKRDLDVWRSTRRDGAWSAPEHLGDVVNGLGEELGPELHGNTLYFATARRSGMGGLDVYAAPATPNGFAAPAALPAPINSAASESDFTMSADGRTALFWRQVDGRGLLHLSRRGRDGWGEPKPLPDHINRGSFNFTPALSRDGRRLTYASTVSREGQAAGMADVYEATLPKEL